MGALARRRNIKEKEREREKESMIVSCSLGFFARASSLLRFNTSRNCSSRKSSSGRVIVYVRGSLLPICKRTITRSSYHDSGDHREIATRFQNQNCHATAAAAAAASATAAAAAASASASAAVYPATKRVR